MNQISVVGAVHVFDVDAFWCCAGCLCVLQRYWMERSASSDARRARLMVVSGGYGVLLGSVFGAISNSYATSVAEIVGGSVFTSANMFCVVEPP